MQPVCDLVGIALGFIAATLLGFPSAWLGPGTQDSLGGPNSCFTWEMPWLFTLFCLPVLSQ